MGFRYSSARAKGTTMSKIEPFNFTGHQLRVVTIDGALGSSLQTSETRSAWRGTASGSTTSTLTRSG